jgi:hypothetical protein
MRSLRRSSATRRPSWHRAAHALARHGALKKYDGKPALYAVDYRRVS